MTGHLFLDTTPLGLLTQRTGRPEAEACRDWLASRLSSGVNVYIPEIADYELRRELVRAGKTAGVARLDLLKDSLRYLPITTEAMLLAADLWARARRRGFVTADEKALDGDVILAAQALSSGIAASEIIVVTSNPSHLSHFLAARRWEEIGA